VLLAAVISMAGLISGGGVATADTRTVQGCYDNAKPYATVIGHKHYPRGYPDGAWLSTTANCADINVTSDIPRLIRVCFDPSSGPPYCQADYKYVTSLWTVVASNVSNGTKFKLSFYAEHKTSGSYAA
jgi:hypothetical protein